MSSFLITNINTWLKFSGSISMKKNTRWNIRSVANRFRWGKLREVFRSSRRKRTASKHRTRHTTDMMFPIWKWIIIKNIILLVQIFGSKQLNTKERLNVKTYIALLKFNNIDISLVFTPTFESFAIQCLSSAVYLDKLDWFCWLERVNIYIARI